MLLVVCCSDWITGIKPHSEEEKWLAANSIVRKSKAFLFGHQIQRAFVGMTACTVVAGMSSRKY